MAASAPTSLPALSPGRPLSSGDLIAVYRHEPLDSPQEGCAWAWNSFDPYRRYPVSASTKPGYYEGLTIQLEPLCASVPVVDTAKGKHDKANCLLIQTPLATLLVATKKVRKNGKLLATDLFTSARIPLLTDSDPTYSMRSSPDYHKELKWAKGPRIASESTESSEVAFLVQDYVTNIVLASSDIKETMDESASILRCARILQAVSMVPAASTSAMPTNHSRIIQRALLQVMTLSGNKGKGAAWIIGHPWALLHSLRFNADLASQLMQRPLFSGPQKDTLIAQWALAGCFTIRYASAVQAVQGLSRTIAEIEKKEKAKDEEEASGSFFMIPGGITPDTDEIENEEEEEKKTN